MTPPLLTDRYRYSRLQETFAQEISERYDLEEVDVEITSSTLADLDNDGESDDLAGTGLLQVGSQFKSFVFLLRESGESRFLETNGNSFDPEAEMRRIPCTESRTWLCHSQDSMDRARRLIRTPRISVREYSHETPGLELTIFQGGGLWAVVNSLAVFLR